MEKDKFWLDAFHPPVPTVFSEAVSYYETMKECYRKMKECLHYLRQHEKQIRKMVEELVLLMEAENNHKLLQKAERGWKSDDKVLISDYTGKINILRNKIETDITVVNQKISALKKDVDSKTKNIYNYINSENGQLRNLIQGNTQSIDMNRNSIQDLSNRLIENQKDFEKLTIYFSSLLSQFTQFKVHVNNIFESNLKRLEDEIEERIVKADGNKIIVVNPTTGKNDSLYNTLRDISEYKHPYPITAKQFNALHITADEFNSLMLTCNEFNDIGYLKLMPFIVNCTCGKEIDRIYSELDQIWGRLNEKYWSFFDTGMQKPYTLYKEIVDFLLKTHGHPITASEFNSLNVTAEAFNHLQIPSHEFNWNFPRYPIDQKLP